MQNLLSITLQENNTVQVSSDVFALSVNDENILTGWARRFTRAEDYQSTHPILKDRLIQWRRELAKEKNLSAFLIITNSTLFAISDMAPTTEEELLAVPGFGPKRFASYGYEILSIIEHSLEEENATE